MLVKILHSIYSFLHEFGKAKAAAHLARIGKYEEAQAVLTSKWYAASSLPPTTARVPQVP